MPRPPPQQRARRKARGAGRVRRSRRPTAAMASALLEGPFAAALLERDVVAAASPVFARALGLDPAECAGRRLAELLPPEGQALRLPRRGDAFSYHTHLSGVAARVDLAAPAGSRYVAVGLSLSLEDADTAQSLALLRLSRELSAATREEELAAAVARALDVLFPTRSTCIRLFEPGSLTLTSLRTRGRLAPAARTRLALRRSAVQKTGLSEARLLAAGVTIVERDEPIFADGERATAVPLAVGGQLYGVINLEYGRDVPGSPESDEPILLQVANQAALAARNQRTLEELTHLKTFLEDLIENANALIAVLNRDREILVFNKALSRLTGYAREEALEEDLLDLVPEKERRRVERVVERSLAGEQVTSFETRLRMRSGGEARIAVNTAAIYGATGEVDGVIVIGQDTTLLRALQERAEHSQKLAEMGRLAAGVVHELANPLTAVSAYSEALYGKLAFGQTDPADLEKLRRIREAAQRLQRLSRDLMAYSRPPTEQREEVDVGALMEQAAAMCEPTLGRVGARLERRIENVPRIFAQKGSLLQVFVNLITNAAQALPPGGGAVRLELTHAGAHVAARVRDQGRGMEPEVQRRIFEPFFSTKGDGTGTGLGLAIVQGIVSRHGGAISVESEPGAGTTFTVLLPTGPPQ